MNRMPLACLHTFVVVADCASFTAAAKSLFLTQGAVSKQIHQLEDYLGVTLFHRHHAGVALTDEGVVFKQYVVEAYALLNRGVASLTLNKKMHLRVLVAPTFATRWLAVNLYDFYASHPDVELSILDFDAKQKADCEIIYAKEDLSHHADLLMTEHNIAVCAPHMYHADVAKVFEGRRLLHILLNNQHKLSLWGDWFAMAKVDGNAGEGLSFSTQDQVINATMSGLGVAIVDRAMIEAPLASGLLMPITADVLMGPYRYWLKLANTENPAIRLFHWWIMNRIKTGLEP